jgi:2'-5' RNA ligase
MKAAIALLADYPVQNYVRRMVYDISQLGEIELLGSLLPAHVSLKQPFAFEAMDRLEGWFEGFCRRAAPLSIELDHVYYHEEGGAHAIVGLNVVETSALRALHNQINQELVHVVQELTAPHDGDEYRFHLTIELGEIGRINPYKQFYDSLPEKRVNLSFMAEYMALFYYTNSPIGSGSFNCYKVLKLLN